MVFGSACQLHSTLNLRARASTAKQPPIGYSGRSYWAVTAMGVAIVFFGIFTPAALAKPSFTTRYTYYSISGGTAGEIYRAMMRQGPRVRGIKSFGTTIAASSQKGRLVQGKSCRIEGYSLHFDFLIKLPRVVNQQALPTVDLTRWQNFSQFVKKHEMTHRAIWLDCANAIEQQTKAIRANNCFDFNKKVEQIWNSVRASCLKQHDAFERTEQAKLKQHPFIKLVHRKFNVTHADIAK